MGRGLSLCRLEVLIPEAAVIMQRDCEELSPNLGFSTLGFGGAESDKELTVIFLFNGLELLSNSFLVKPEPGPLRF